MTFNQNRTPEEAALHKLLVMWVETNETERYPMPQSSPDEILRHIKFTFEKYLNDEERTDITM
ncbi:MAG: hypothetical protein AAFY20_00275 [Cyanobacteria bacterium J06639_14]